MPFQKQIPDPKTGEMIFVNETLADIADREQRQAFGEALQQREEARTAAIEALPAREEIEKMTKLPELRDLVLKLYDVVQHLVGKV